MNDPHNEYYQEGLCAMWSAYENYQADKGTMATYFNFVIRNRLIDLNRREKNKKLSDELMVRAIREQLHDGNKRHNGEATHHVIPIMKNIENNPELWQQIKSLLTENQWKWVHYHIMLDMAIKDIALQENTTIDAVKGWGRLARKKLSSEAVRKKLDLGGNT